jgi:hypothetical protein
MRALYAPQAPGFSHRNGCTKGDPQLKPSPLEEQQQLADELYPRFDAWVRTRNQIKARLARAPRLVAIIRPRPRGAGKPRAQAARSSAASGDSGDPDLDDPPGGRAHPYSGVAA